jgi:hypothetical protein
VEAVKNDLSLKIKRKFSLAWPIPQTASGELTEVSGTKIRHTASGFTHAASGCQIAQRASAQSESPSFEMIVARFPLPWSHYLQLPKVDKPEARAFYESEAPRCGSTVRQRERQITTLFYERTLASKNKAAMLRKGAEPKAGKIVTPEKEIRDPLVLEFLVLKDEYSENKLEEALIQQLETKGARTGNAIQSP